MTGQAAGQGSATITAVLDTCVLFPARLRDVLLELAKRGLYRPVWSTAILAELDCAVANRRAELGHSAAETASYLDRLRSQITLHFPRSCINGWEQYVPSIVLPDREDRHVVAVAIAADASLIVTANLKDFPASNLPPSIRAEGLDEFLCQLAERDRDDVWAGLHAVCDRTGRQGASLAIDDLLAIIDTRYGARKFVARLD